MNDEHRADKEGGLQNDSGIVYAKRNYATVYLQLNMCVIVVKICNDKRMEYTARVVFVR